jgi:hypothetical protein
LTVLAAAGPVRAEKCEAERKDEPTPYVTPISVYRSAAGLDGPMGGGGRGAGANTWRETAKTLSEPLPAGGYYFRCKFDYASQILAERRKTLGDDHPYVHAWLRNQNAVFQACRDWDHSFGPGPTLASGFGDDVDALAQADFAYQHAAWRYYIASQSWFRDGVDNLKEESQHIRGPADRSLSYDRYRPIERHPIAVE